MQFLKGPLFDGDGEAPIRHARAIAWSSLLAWVGATTAGRLMGYLVPIAGLQ
jgi:hypothetical protein